MLYTRFLWWKDISVSDDSSHLDILLSEDDDQVLMVNKKKLSAGEQHNSWAFFADYKKVGENRWLQIEHPEWIIIYDICLWSDSENLFENEQNKKRNLYIADLEQQPESFHLWLLKAQGGARYVVPFPNVWQDIAISFARQVMGQELGIPKFFMKNQQLIHL